MNGDRLKTPIPAQIEMLAFEETKKQMHDIISAMDRVYDNEHRKLVDRVMQKHNCTEEAARKAIEQMEDMYYSVLTGEER